MDRKLTFAFYGRDVSAGRTMRGVAGETEGLRSKSLAAAKAVSVLAGGAAVAGLTSALKTGFRELSDYQGGLSQLRAGMKSTHNQANVTIKGMEGLAHSIQSYSGQTDDSIVKTEQLLLTFPKIRNEAGKTNKIFDRTVKIAADMAARMGGDASSQAIRLGRALQDPVKGMTALTRAGVVFTDQQKAQNKALVEGGIQNALGAMGFVTTATQFNAVLKENNNNVNAAVRQITGPLSKAQQQMFRHYEEGGHAIEAQKNILKELDKEFSGSARMYGRTLPGQLDRLKRSWEDLTQQLAQALLPYALRFTKWLRQDALPALEDFGGWVKRNKTELEWFGGIVGGLAVGFKAFKAVRSVQSLVGRGPAGAGGALGKAGVVPVYVTNMGALGGGGKAGTRGGFGSGLFGGAVAALATTNIVKNQLGMPHSSSIPSRAANAAGSALIFGTTGGEVSGTNHVLPPVNASDIRPLTDAEKHLKAAGLAGIQFVQSQKQAAAAAKYDAQQLAGLNQLLVKGPGLAGAAAQAHDRLALSMRGVVAEAKIEAATLGHDLGRGLIAGIEAEIPHATVAGKLLVSSTVKQMRLAADAHSPSRETAKLGKDLADGLFNGFMNVKVWDKLAVETRHGLMQLSRTAQNARDYQTNIRGGLLDYANITSAGTATDSFGSPMGSTNTRTYMRSRVRKLRTFLHLLRKAEDMGLDRSELADIAQAGPDAIPELRDIISSGRAGVRTINRLDRRAHHLANETASFATTDRYGAALERLLQRLPRHLAHELAKELRHVNINVNLHEHDRKQGKKIRQHHG